MNCALCRNGTYEEGVTTIVLTKEQGIVIIKEVPALICNQCGEYILSEEIASKVMQIAKSAMENGAEIEIRKFIAA